MLLALVKVELIVDVEVHLGADSTPIREAVVCADSVLLLEAVSVG